jgi:hypothetical protein
MHERYGPVSKGLAQAEGNRIAALFAPWSPALTASVAESGGEWDVTVALAGVAEGVSTRLEGTTLVFVGPEDLHLPPGAANPGWHEQADASLIARIALPPMVSPDGVALWISSDVPQVVRLTLGPAVGGGA